MGILDDYKAQLEEDRKNENNDFPEDSTLNESQRKEYEKCLKELRNSSDDIERVYQKKKAEMRQLKEDEMHKNGLIKGEEVKRVIVIHSFCEDCGEELISNAPPMFNPFTFEKVCKHVCSKCGKIYNLEFAYPRLAFLNDKGEEITAFTR